MAGTGPMPAPAAGAARPARRARRGVRLALRGALALAAAVGAYCGAAEVLMRLPVHAGADPLAGDVDVYLVSNGVHVDVWLPARHPDADWAAWLPPEVPVDPYGYVAFGWGERRFYLEVPTWDDLTLPIAAQAVLLPSPTAMHVSAWGGPPRPGDEVHLLRVDAAHYAALVEFVRAGFALDAAGRPALLEGPGYGASDRFFAGRGAYHAFRTCNTWTNRAVQVMGKTAARWAAFERGARFHLPRNRGRATPGAGR